MSWFYVWLWTDRLVKLVQRTFRDKCEHNRTRHTVLNVQFSDGYASSQTTLECDLPRHELDPTWRRARLSTRRSTMISTVPFASARRARIQKQHISARTVMSIFVSSVSSLSAVSMGRWDVRSLINGARFPNVSTSTSAVNTRPIQYSCIVQKTT